MPEAIAIHGVELRVGCLIADDRDAARAPTELPHCVGRARVVGAVHARLHDDDPIHVQPAMQRSHLRCRRGLGRVDTARPEPELCRIAEDVCVAIAGAGRHREVHRRRRLGRLRERVAAPSKKRGRRRGKMNQRRTARYHGGETIRTVKILGIETPCDETSAAVVVETGDAGKPWAIQSNVIASQVPIHREWGGVVPELASRQHIRDICSPS
jgi:hypothetical protein